MIAMVKKVFKNAEQNFPHNMFAILTTSRREEKKKGNLDAKSINLFLRMVEG